MYSNYLKAGVHFSEKFNFADKITELKGIIWGVVASQKLKYDILNVNISHTKKLLTF